MVPQQQWYRTAASVQYDKVDQLNVDPMWTTGENRSRDTRQCTMVLAIENKERKICKSKWLDFTHFSTNYYFFGLYCCETANI